MNIAGEQAEITTGIAMFVSNTTPARLCQSAAQEENRIPLRFFLRRLRILNGIPLRIPFRFFSMYFFCIDHQI